MDDDANHLRQQAERARRWAAWVADPRDRERLEAVARDYDRMVQATERRAHLGED